MTHFQEIYHICVYVPESDIDRFIKSLAPEIPAFLGNYDQVCWWSEKGTEQSRALDSLKTERVHSCKIEFTLPRDDSELQRILHDIILPHHPWDEPVIIVKEGRIYDAAPR